MPAETRHVPIETRLALSADQFVRLIVDEWRYHPDQNFVSVSYRVRNESRRGSIAVFDRENHVPHPSYVYSPGNIGAPIVNPVGADVELIHAVRTADDRSAGVPLAIEVAREEQIYGRFSFSIGEVRPKRLRWCVGVMPFEKHHFDRPYGSGNGTIWLVKNDVESLQKMLCTPWYDVVQAKFEPTA